MMKTWKNVPGIVLALLILATGYARGQVQPTQDTLDPKACTADPRLNTLVNLDVERMCLGDILAKVSAQTGVSVSIPATEPLSGIPITCHVKKLSLANFMNSLWSLVGYTDATWQITIDSKQHPPAYYLLPTAKSHKRADLLMAKSDTAAENLWKLYETISLLPAKERQAYIKPLTAALLMDSDDLAKRYLQDSPGSNVMWDMLSIVPTELSPEQQKQLQQGVGISIPLSSMTPVHQELMRPYIGHGFTVRNGVRTENPSPDHMTFKFSRSIGTHKDLFRNLWIGVNPEGSFGGLGILSPLEMGLKQRQSREWILSGDALNSEKETEIFNAVPPRMGNTVQDHTQAFDQLLAKIGDTLAISYIAVVPDQVFMDLPPDNGKPLGQIFTDLQRYFGTMHKWRNGVLLCNYQAWFYGDEGLTGFGVAQQVRSAGSRRDDNPMQWLRAAAEAFVPLNQAQAKRTVKESPEVGQNRRLQPIFLLCKKYPGILTMEGHTVDLNMRHMMSQFKLIPTTVQGEEIDSIRIVTAGTTSLEQPLYVTQFRLLHHKEWNDLERFQLFRPVPASDSPPVRSSH